MNVGISFHPGDEAQAHRWFEWCAELGGCEQHDLTVLPFKGLEAPKIYGWKSVTVLRDFAGIKSNWTVGDAVRDASGPNHAFREMAKHFAAKKAGSWLWMEADATPLAADWLDKFAAEYARCGKRFMGTIVENELTPRHMSGIGIYPEDLAIRCLDTYMRPRLARFGDKYVEAAFDVAGADDALKDCHHTDLIEYRFRQPEITTQEGFDGIPAKAVIFHTDKTGGLIPFVRAKLSGRQVMFDSSGQARVEPKAVPFNISEVADSLRPAPKLGEQFVRVEDVMDRVSCLLTTIDARLLRVESALALRHAPKPNGKPKRTAAEQAKINARMAKARAARAK